MATIVLAEDDPHIIRIVSMWLKKHQHTIFEAPNGKRALELVLEHQADLLITDVNMPLMGGTELARAASEHGLPRLGTVMLTSRVDQSELRDQIEGLNVTLRAKPFSPTGLMKDVEALLSGKGVSV